MDQNTEEQGMQAVPEDAGQFSGEYIQQGEYTQQQSGQQGSYTQQSGQQGNPYQQYNQQGEYAQQPYQQYNRQDSAYQQYNQQDETYQQYNQQDSPYQQYNQQDSPYQQYRQQGQNSYSQYQNYNKSRQSNGIGFGVASMIMGIVSLILFCTCINIPVAIAGIILGIIYLCGQPESKVYGIVGIITSALSIFAFIAMISLAWVPAQSYYQEIEDSIDLRLPNGIYDGDDIFDEDDIFNENDFFEDYNPIRPHANGKEGKAIWRRF